MSLFDRLRDETEEEGESDQPATDGGDAATDDPFDDGEFGEMGDEFGDEDGFGDLSMMDEGDDEYATEELERRVDDVETELASISSTVNTIRSETEEISNTVESVEENVRKLLDVYEMVTRGINPFTDDLDDAGAAVGGGSLGLFDDEADEAETDDLDEEVANADADSFFDDEFEEGEEKAQDLDGDSDDTEETEGDSFADLKAEYDSGEAEWNEEGAGFEAATTATDPAATVTTEDSSEREVDTELQYAEHTLSDAPDAEKPYLRGSFDGYIADLLVLEWLEYLVDAAGPAATEGAISYYESIRWIDEDAGEQLRAFIDGFATSENEEETANLTVAHHTQSLRYICQLSSSTAAPVVLDGWKEHPRSYRR